MKNDSAEEHADSDRDPLFTRQFRATPRYAENEPIRREHSANPMFSVELR